MLPHYFAVNFNPLSELCCETNERLGKRDQKREKQSEAKQAIDSTRLDSSSIKGAALQAWHGSDGDLGRTAVAARPYMQYFFYLEEGKGMNLDERGIRADADVRDRRRVKRANCCRVCTYYVST